MPKKKATKSTAPAKSGQSSSQKVARKTPAKKVEKTTQIPETMAPRKESTSKSSSSRWNNEKIIATLKRPQIFIPVAILLAVIVVYLLKSWFVVATVNGQFITRPAFDSSLEQQYGKQALSGLITEKLLEQEANKRGTPVTQTDIDNQIKKISQQLASQGTTLDTALAAQGMNRAQLEDQVRVQELISKLVGNKANVSDKEINDYIAQNKDSLPTGESDSQLKATAKQQLQQQKLQSAAQGLVQKLQQQAHITYFINL